MKRDKRVSGRMKQKSVPAAQNHDGSEPESRKIKAGIWHVSPGMVLQGLQGALLELLTASPLLLIAAGLVNTGAAAGWLWLAGLIGYTVLAASAAALRPFRWTGVLILVNGTIIAGWTWLLYGITVQALAAAAAGIVLALRASSYVRGNGRLQFHPFLLWVGFGVCAPVAFFIHNLQDLEAYSSSLPVLAAVLFAAAMLVSNTASMSMGAYSRNMTASGRSMRRFNRILVAAFTVPVVAVALWGLVNRGLRQLGRWLVMLINTLLPDDQAGTPVPIQPPAQQSGMDMLPRDNEGPGIIWIILDYLLIAAFIAGSALVLFFLARGLYRRLPGWLRAVYAWITRNRSGQEEQEAGYIDVVTSTRAERERERAGAWKRLRQLWSGDGARWEGLQSNRERIRYLYSQGVRRSIRQGLSWKPQWTPAETAREASRLAQGGGLSPELCRAYEEARYGDREADDTATARLREEMSKKA